MLICLFVCFFCRFFGFYFKKKLTQVGSSHTFLTTFYGLWALLPLSPCVPEDRGNSESKIQNKTMDFLHFFWSIGISFLFLEWEIDDFLELFPSAHLAQFQASDCLSALARRYQRENNRETNPWFGGSLTSGFLLQEFCYHLLFRILQ